MPTSAPGATGRVDRVAAAGALVALAGLLSLPFVEFRANRIVSGVPVSVWSAGGWSWVLLALVVAALALALSPPSHRRGLGVMLAGAGTVAALPWALGSTALHLLQDTAPATRVSIGAAAWLVLTGGAVVWFAGSRSVQRDIVRPIVAAMVLVLFAASMPLGGGSQLSLIREYGVQGARFWRLVGEHLLLSGLGLGFGTLLGTVLGVTASRQRVIRASVLGAVGMIQTVPSLALLGLLVLPLAALGLPGIGTLPAVIALTLYALLPIVRNTVVGLDAVDRGALDAGRGMGMSRGQLFFRVEMPLALPLVLEGIRAAAVLVIGIAAVTAFVGAGGLGILVFQGWGQQADDLTLLGALPMVVLAVLADLLMRGLARVTVSPGIQKDAAA